MSGISPQQKEGYLKKRRKRKRSKKSKRGEPSFEKLHISKGAKKQRMRFTNF
jgi:hypothetical protein